MKRFAAAPDTRRNLWQVVFFQIFERLIGGDNHRQMTLPSVINDLVELVSEPVRGLFDPKVIEDEELDFFHAIEQLVIFGSYGRIKGLFNSIHRTGHVEKEHFDQFLLHQLIGQCASGMRFARTNIAPEKESEPFGFHVLPLFDVVLALLLQVRRIIKVTQSLGFEVMPDPRKTHGVCNFFLLPHPKMLLLLWGSFPFLEQIAPFAALTAEVAVTTAVGLVAHRALRVAIIATLVARPCAHDLAC